MDIVDFPRTTFRSFRLTMVQTLQYIWVGTCLCNFSGFTGVNTHSTLRLLSTSPGQLASPFDRPRVNFHHTSWQGCLLVRTEAGQSPQYIVTPVDTPDTAFVSS